MRDPVLDRLLLLADDVWGGPPPPHRCPMCHAEIVAPLSRWSTTADHGALSAAVVTCPSQYCQDRVRRDPRWPAS